MPPLLSLIGMPQYRVGRGTGPGPRHVGDAPINASPQLGGSATATARDPEATSRGYVLLVLAALTALNHLDRQLMNIVLELVRHEFALSDVQLGLLSGLSFALVYTTLSIPAALWVVRHDRRNLVAAAAALWGTMTVLCGAAQSFAQLLIARVGVGIGEAGGPAPSQAMLSDLYRPGERATAMALLTAGVNAGVFLAFLVGGYIGHTWGWRHAFVVGGVMTVGLAAVLQLTVRDPPRSADADGFSAAGPQSTMLVRETVSAIWSDPALRQLFIGATLISTVAYAEAVWLPSFIMRSHNLNIAVTGAYLATVVGLGGALGAYLGGALSDRFGQRDIRWSLWLVALVYLAGKPLLVAFYLTNDTLAALMLLALPAMVGTIFFGPSIAVLHDRVSATLRPIASAVFLLILTMIGLGLGPLLVGAMSQYVFFAYGDDSLRYAMLIMEAAGLWGVVHYYLAGRQLAHRRGP